MTDELVYDPRTKDVIKNEIYQFLYSPVDKEFAKRLKTIIVKNSLLHGNDQDWVSYKGEYYSASSDSMRPRPINRLKPELKPHMDEYLADVQRINNEEMPYVLGFITQVLNSSNSIQDYFKIFPESTHKPIRELVKRCGCRKESLEDDQVAKIQRRNEIPIELMKKRMVLNLLI